MLWYQYHYCRKCSICGIFCGPPISLYSTTQQSKANAQNHWILDSVDSVVLLFFAHFSNVAHVSNYMGNEIKKKNSRFWRSFVYILTENWMWFILINFVLQMKFHLKHQIVDVDAIKITSGDCNEQRKKIKENNCANKVRGKTIFFCSFMKNEYKRWIEDHLLDFYCLRC